MCDDPQLLVCLLFWRQSWIQWFWKRSWLVLDTIVFHLNRAEIASFPLISSNLSSVLTTSLKAHVTSAWPTLGKLHYCPFSAISNRLLLLLQQLSFTFLVSSNSHEELFSAGFFFLRSCRALCQPLFLLFSHKFLPTDVKGAPITPTHKLMMLGKNESQCHQKPHKLLLRHGHCLIN